MPAWKRLTSALKEGGQAIAETFRTGLRDVAPAVPKPAADAARERSRTAQRNILLRWNDMSPGDVSSVLGSLRGEGASVMTVEGCGHHYFWTQCVTLGWAVEEDVAPAIKTILPATRIFRATERGRRMIAGFIDFRKLADTTFYNAAPKGRKPPILMRPDGVIVLVDPKTRPANHVLLPAGPAHDAMETAMTGSGNTVERYEPGISAA